MCRTKEDNAYYDIPVMFVTAPDDENNETTGLELGAVDHITKPFKSNFVKLRAKNQIELKRRRDILSRLSSTDGLTGIANRRFFDDFLKQEWIMRCMRFTYA
ncbi:hypothetical protein [Candidatus Magnetominusculus dajiuhuensis]|uniref:hypothetical protein n=1 Tax=Candidatus Magnetominusculus dajiuhuensis TaxID=3137712 RepID=UPI003B42F6D9